MRRCQVVVFADHGTSVVNERLFGSFVEHLGRCVYGGIYDPDSPYSDESGFRLDVIERCKDLGVSVVRYPGGNFVSSYVWEDGVGPKKSRPRRLDLAWRSLETNEFGINEFGAWCTEAGVEGMIAVNLGTRGAAAATQLVEYCNHPGGSYWSEQRREHGIESPHNFRLWCLGNEMDGPWQVGHRSAAEYGSLASEVARAMQRVDPEIKLVVAGSSNRQMPTFPNWDREVLELTYDDVDYLSVHQYYQATEADPAGYLMSALDFNAYLDEAIATCDYVRALKRSSKRMQLSVDEWNVTHSGEGSRHEPWAIAPSIGEYSYTALDAVVEASLMMAILGHAERTAIACQSLLVNVGGPIRTETSERAYGSAIFAPLARMAGAKGGTVHPVEVEGPPLDANRGSSVPDLDAVCVRSMQGDTIDLYLVNRNHRDSVEVSIELLGEEGGPEVVQESIHAAFTEGGATRHSDGHNLQLDRHQIHCQGPGISVTLPPASWHALRFPAPPAP